MTDREQFRALAMVHGMRDAHFIELAEAAGLVGDISTKEGREASLRAFKNAKPHLFGSDHGTKTVMEAMTHVRFSGKSASQEKADRASQLDRHVGAFVGRVDTKGKSALDMSPEEANALEAEIKGREQTNARLRFQRDVHNAILGGHGND